MSNEPREAKGLNKLKEQANINKSKFTRDKHKSIHLKKSNAKVWEYEKLRLKIVL